MNRLVVESGSTKTDWFLVKENGEEVFANSSGINPITQSHSSIVSDQEPTLSKLSREVIDRVEFYGAGCGDAKACKSIEDIIGRYFQSAEIEVQSDLMAAARALFGNEPGIACILGTGSNSAAYDGETIIQNVPALGYLLGDEGSGNAIGKLLLKDYFRGDMPTVESKLFDEHFGADRWTALRSVYAQAKPNQFLAALLGEVVAKDRHSTYFESIIREAFCSFIENCLKRYERLGDWPVGFVGSVAYHFQDILHTVCSEHQLDVKNIIKQPILELKKVKSK